MVSILIPAFNAGPWIRQCVESALAQTYAATEILVVDDGSTDDTLEIVRSFGSRVRVIPGAHAGGNAARNRLLELSSGEWLQYLDADDYLLPGKIAAQMECAAKNPGLDLIYSPVILREEATGSEHLLEMSEEADLPLHFIRWGQLNTNGFLWRRASVLKVGGWKEDQPACQEHELLLRMIEAGMIEAGMREAGHRFQLVNRPGAVYRFHHAPSVSRQNPLRTVQLQAGLLSRLEEYLKRQKALTPVHRKALYITRMQAARTAWKTDPALAKTLAAQAKSTGAWWVSSSPALPLNFQILTRFVGFEASERLAARRRPMVVTEPGNAGI